MDRYALLDSGRAAPRFDERTNDALESNKGPDRATGRQPSSPVLSLPQRAPDALIDSIVPMLDAALSLDGGPTPAGGSPAAVRADLRRSFGGSPPRSSHEAREADRDEDPEDRIGLSVLETCLETQRAIVDRLGEQERREFDAGLEALERGGHGDPRDLAGAQPSLAARPPEPICGEMQALSAAGLAGEGPRNARTAPLVDAQPARQYSQLFSALRKKFRDRA